MLYRSTRSLCCTYTNCVTHTHKNTHKLAHCSCRQHEHGGHTIEDEESMRRGRNSHARLRTLRGRGYAWRLVGWFNASITEIACRVRLPRSNDVHPAQRTTNTRTTWTDGPGRWRGEQAQGVGRLPENTRDTATLRLVQAEIGVEGEIGTHINTCTARMSGHTTHRHHTERTIYNILYVLSILRVYISSLCPYTRE